MKNILLIHSLVEIIGGFVLIFNPQFLLANADPEIQGVVVSKLYGIMILSFGMISYILYKNFAFTHLYKMTILVIVTLHFVIGLYMYGVFQQSLTPHLGGCITHLSLAIIFLIIYLQNLQKFNDDKPIA